METESKRFSLNGTDAMKLLKSIGIAAGAFASVIYLAINGYIDADLMTSLYTSIGTVLVAAVVRFISGPAETK